MEHGYPPVAADEAAGREMASGFGGSAHQIIAMDTDVLRDAAGQWQLMAARVRDGAQEAVKIAIDATSQSHEFISEYQTEGEYISDYTAMTETSTRLQSMANQVAERCERLASALAWIADNKDEVERLAAATTSTIDTNLDSGGGGSVAHPTRDADGYTDRPPAVDDAENPVSDSPGTPDAGSPQGGTVTISDSDGSGFTIDSGGTVHI